MAFEISILSSNCQLPESINWRIKRKKAVVGIKLRADSTEPLSKS
jgi:hypothetical protein